MADESDGRPKRRLMLAKRIIPCLDVTAGRVVKGTNFVDLRDAGDPIEIARRYDEQGADEVTFLDITASSRPARHHPAHRRSLRRAGFHSADRRRRRAQGRGCPPPAQCRGRQGVDEYGGGAEPDLVFDASSKVGSQCIVVAIDAKQVAPGKWHVFTHGGRNDTGLDAVDWAKRVEMLGAGEILLTSMDRDGTKNGFDLALTRARSPMR